MSARIVVAIGLLAASAVVCNAQPAFTSAEGRSMSFELMVSNSAPHVVTIADIHANSGQSSGKRTHTPIRVRQQVPTGATGLQARAAGDVGAASAEMQLNAQMSIHHKIEWTVRGTAYTCNAKFPATYRASDKKVVVQMGDLASLMTPEGRPIPSKCQD